MKRREFLHVIGAAGATASLGGCARGGGPVEVMPYLLPTDDGVLPGVSAEYATVCRECPAGCGMMALVRDGRTHKVEGNPDHPVSRGKLCLRGQTALQGLYNPDRNPESMARDAQGRLQRIPWNEAETRFDEALARAKTGRSAWIGQLETGAFPHLLDRWLAVMAPSHLRLVYEPLAYEPLRAASKRVFGAAEIPEFRIDRAHHLLSFGADFVETWISNVEYTRQFSAWRQARVNGVHRGRYVFMAPRLSLTGQNADEWITLRPGTEGLAAQAIMLIVQAARSRAAIPPEISTLAEQTGVRPETLERIGRSFAAGGPSLALPLGNAQNQPGAADANETILRLNQIAGSVNRTVIPGWPHALSAAGTQGDMMALISEMHAGRIDVLFVHNVNPVYNLPASTQFAEALKNVPLIVSFSSQPDETTGALGETGGYASLVLPDHTPLESWGEYTPRPGITGILQPVVAPVFSTRATADLLLESAARHGHNLGAKTFDEYLRHEHPMDDAAWMSTLQRGGIFRTAEEVKPVAETSKAPLSGTIETLSGAGRGTAMRPAIGFATSIFDSPVKTGGASPSPALAASHPGNPTPALPASGEGANLPPLAGGMRGVSGAAGGMRGVSGAAGGMTGVSGAAQAPGPGQLILQIYPSLQFYDGRLANRPWSQEIPDAVVKAVWGSWAEIHPNTAKTLGVRAAGTILILESAYGRIDIPAYPSQGVHPEAIAIQLGQGHTHSGQFSKDLGRNPLALLGPTFDPASGALLVSGMPVFVRAVEAVRPVVVLQTTEKQHSTGFARSMSITDLTRAPVVENEKDRISLYSTVPPRLHHHARRKWGMVIDLDRCVGCNSCVAACYAENNVPVVGKDECSRGREMSWIRIETYMGGASSEGVPDNRDPASTQLDVRFFPMVCMQCDNAPCEYVCPVFATEHNDEGLNMQVYNRCVGTRFCSNNCPYKVRRFNWFTYRFPFPLNNQLNPDVIHRAKGVMEKCSFCIQRIRRHEIDAGTEHRAIQDGEIQTACMQACPADAIVFGDQDDKKSFVSRHFARERRGYGALEDLNTYPNVQYLERVRVETE